MRHLARAALCAAVVFALPTLAGAQILGTVAGSARDASGAVLPGVNVEVSSPALIERVRTATTDGTGLYRIVNLPPGVYAVTFTLQGFNTVKREQVQVQAGFTATIDGEMKVGAVQETVTVTGQSPVIDVQSAAADPFSHRRHVQGDSVQRLMAADGVPGAGHSRVGAGRRRRARRSDRRDGVRARQPL